MGITSYLPKFITRHLVPKVVRVFDGARIDRLSADWGTPLSSFGDDILKDHKAIRSRARKFAVDSPYARRYFDLLRSEVIGAEGYTLQNEATLEAADPNGQPITIADDYANNLIESEWHRWGNTPSLCDYRGQLTIAELDQLTLLLTARDGFAIQIFHPHAQGIAIQVLDATYLDVDRHRKKLPNGNRLVASIEYDLETMRPIAYHFKGTTPGEGEFASFDRQLIRIPADRVAMVYDPLHATDCIGLSWLAPVMLRLIHLERYTEAELVAARAEACKIWSWEYDQNGAGQSDDRLVTKPSFDLSPGAINDGGPGRKLVSHNPTHPNGSYVNFHKQVAGEIAAGLMLSYPTLTGALDQVNLSSIRAGVLIERSNWRRIQTLYANRAKRPQFTNWLRVRLSMRLGNLEASAFDRLNCPRFQGKRWQMHDPVKDLMAYGMQVDRGWMANSDVIAQLHGQELATVEQRRAKDAALKAKLNPQGATADGGIDKGTANAVALTIANFAGLLIDGKLSEQAAVAGLAYALTIDPADAAPLLGLDPADYQDVTHQEDPNA